MGKSEMERKGNFAPSYLSFPVPFRPFQINPAFLSLSEKNGQLSGKGNIAFLSLTCMEKLLNLTFTFYTHILCRGSFGVKFSLTSSDEMDQHL